MTSYAVEERFALRASSFLLMSALRAQHANSEAGPEGERWRESKKRTKEKAFPDESEGRLVIAAWIFRLGILPRSADVMWTQAHIHVRRPPGGILFLSATEWLAPVSKSNAARFSSRHPREGGDPAT